jgi:hypothetical protein
MNLQGKLLSAVWKKVIHLMLRHAENQIDLNSYDKELSRKIDVLRYLSNVM